MLTELLNELGWLKRPNKHVKQIELGEFKISGGELTPSDFLRPGQYFYIAGSVFNDGVYQFPAPSLQDETFEGAVWALSVPPSLIALADEIKTYCESDAGKPSAFTSESFGGYSYTRAAGENGAPLSWQQQFAGRLKQWRIM